MRWPSFFRRARTSMLGLLLSGLWCWHAEPAGLRRSFTGLRTRPKSMCPLQQPIPFSHKHHVTDDGIDCRYCHTSVEKSSFAGIPSTETCMTCHSQIWTDAPMLASVRESLATGKPLKWTRVNDLPDYVYFNHSVHVAKGIGCSNCHGRVDQMPLTRKAQTLYMRWCLDCHENPQKYIRPRDKVFDAAWQPPPDQLEQGQELIRQYHVDTSGRLTNCSACHR